VRVVRGSYREAWASVTRNRNLRLAQLSSVSAWTGEFLFLTAMTVYAFDSNGAVGVGLIGFLRVLPATVALPWLGALADRISRRQLLVVTCGLRAVTAAGAGAAVAVAGRAAGAERARRQPRRRRPPVEPSAGGKSVEASSAGLVRP